VKKIGVSRSDDDNVLGANHPRKLDDLDFSKSAGENV
jgi:hypothetical protein